jgi:hypothetical protein
LRHTLHDRFSFPCSNFYRKCTRRSDWHDGRMLNIRYPMEVSLQGDSKETLTLILC